MADDLAPDEVLYEVMGGQGHQRLAANLTFAGAERFKRDFDDKCFANGLMNPPTLIRRQTYGRAR